MQRCRSSLGTNNISQFYQVNFAFLQDEHGEVYLGIRWTWKWQSQFVGAEGRQTLQNENRICLQQNLCQDGKYYVRGALIL